MMWRGMCFGWGCFGGWGGVSSAKSAVGGGLSEAVGGDCGAEGGIVGAVWASGLEEDAGKLSVSFGAVWEEAGCGGGMAIASFGSAVLP